MPTYEYVCKACDLEFEREQRISDPPIKTCPRCKSKQVKKLISRTAFHLKGGGWYSDLYSKGPKKGEKGEKGGAAKPAAESGGAADAGAKSADTGSKAPDSGSKGPDSGSKAAA
jgi:putative FmdB family regulatory protein